MVKRKLSEWNLFVMDVKKNNPELQFKEVLKLASKLKKSGKNSTNTLKPKKGLKKRKTNKRKTNKRKTNKRKR